jgi:sugar lactone lactonase YvrE
MRNHYLWAASLVLPGVLAACGGDDDAPCAVGEVCVWAGTGERGYNNTNPDAHRLDSKLYLPSDLTFDTTGRAYILDWNNHLVRRAELDGSLVAVVGTDYEGDGDVEMNDRLPVGSPTGAPGLEVAMNHPTEAEFGPDGKLYISAWHNNKVRVFDPATNIVTVLTGETYGFKGDGGSCFEALLNQPKSIAIASDGTLYTNDQRNVRIRRITPDNVITTIAGTGTVGNIGDGGDAKLAQFGFDIGTTPRVSGNVALVDNVLYVADSNNNRIRKIDLATNIITNVAGDPAGTAGFVDGVGGEARFDQPIDLELGPDGKMYVADRYNNVIRTIDLATGAVATVVGNGKRCELSSQTCTNADRSAPLETQLHEPYGIAFDPQGNLYVADTHNNRIVEVPR